MTTKNPHIVRSRYRIFYALLWGAFALGYELVMFVLVEHHTIGIIGYGSLKIALQSVWWLWVSLSVGALLWGYVLNVFLRRVVIDREQGCATYYSILRPWGKRFFFRDYTGIYITTDSSRFPNGYGIHLVDEKRIVRLMSCVFYRNYDQLREAIPLPEVKKHI